MVLRSSSVSQASASPLFFEDMLCVTIVDVAGNVMADLHVEADSKFAELKSAVRIASAVAPLAMMIGRTRLQDLSDQLPVSAYACNGAIVVTYMAADGDNRDFENESVLPVPKHRWMVDPLRYSRIARQIGSATLKGRAVALEVGSSSGQLLYLIEYDDGDLQHMTYEECNWYLLEKASESREAWQLDPLREKRVTRRSGKGLGLKGTVVSLYVGDTSDEKLYLVQWDNGFLQHVTPERLSEKCTID